MSTQHAAVDASNPENAPARPTPPMSAVLASPLLRGLLWKYCSAEYSTENLSFLELCDALAGGERSADISLAVLMRDYIAADGTLCINIPDSARNAVMEAFDPHDASGSNELHARINFVAAAVLRLMERDSYTRFMNNPDMVLGGQGKHQLLKEIKQEVKQLKAEYNPDAPAGPAWPRTFQVGFNSYGSGCSSSSNSSNSSSSAPAKPSGLRAVHVNDVSTEEESNFARADFMIACQTFIDDNDIDSLEMVVVHLESPQFFINQAAANAFLEEFNKDASERSMQGLKECVQNLQRTEESKRD